MEGKLQYKDLTEKIIGIAYRVYNDLGCGYPERIYQSALELEFKEASIPYKRELYCKVEYLEHQIGAFRIDFLIDNKVAVELKSRDQVYQKDIAQLLTYLRLKLIKVGLLIVFTNRNVIIKRLVY